MMAREKGRALDGALGNIEPIRQDASNEVVRQLLQSFYKPEGLRPGDRLPSERELASAFGVGRSAIREALKTLSFLGLIEIRPGAGAFLQPPEGQFLPQVFEWSLLLGERRAMDLVETRALLEVSVAGLAAERRGDETLAELERYVRIMEEGSVEESIDADIAFHLALARCTNNEVLSEILSNIQSLLRVWIRRVLEAQGAGDLVEQHRLVLNAVVRRDPDAARQAMEQHMSSARRRLLQTIP